MRGLRVTTWTVESWLSTNVEKPHSDKKCDGDESIIRRRASAGTRCAGRTSSRKVSGLRRVKWGFFLNEGRKRCRRGVAGPTGAEKMAYTSGGLAKKGVREVSGEGQRYGAKKPRL